MTKKQRSEFPFSLEDRTGCITYPIIAIEETFQAVRVVYREQFPYPKVADHSILRAHIAPDREASFKENTIYYVPPASENPISTHLSTLRRTALEHGATPEAIRLLGSLEPWTKKEENIMAEKLKAKASAAKPDKETLKSAAKSAPVGGKKGSSPAKKGNAEALAKARAAKGPDNRKIKALIKTKDINARAGSKRHEMLTALLGSKTVQEFRDKGYTSGDLNYAIGAGVVSAS